MNSSSHAKKDFTDLKEQLANLHVLFDTAILNEQSFQEIRILYLQIKDLEAFMYKNQKKS